MPGIPDILGIGCFDGLGLCWNIWGGIRGVLILATGEEKPGGVIIGLGMPGGGRPIMEL